MPQIDVRHLRFRGRPEQASRAEFVIADALRTGIPDDGRLVLVRRLALGRIGLRGQTAALATGAAWRDVLGAARHGASSGAESANCVWFTDAAEARRVLLRELAHGRTPAAWFWPLAVPEWRGLSLGDHLRGRLDVALADGTGIGLAELLRDVVAAECVDGLAAAILARVPVPPATAVTARRVPTAPAESFARDHGRDLASAVSQLDGPEAQLVAALMSSLPPALLQVLVQAAAQSPRSPLIETLARGLLLRAHPALALAPARLAAVQAAVAGAVRTGRIEREASGRPGEAIPSFRREQRARPLLQPTTQRSNPTAPSRPLETASPQLPDGDTAEPTGPTLSPQQRRAAEPAELRSESAGLFLTIAPLIRLGWREWLAEHPDLLFEQPGPRLLHHLAARYRVAPADAARLALPDLDLEHEPSPALAEALECWRAGLDRWLRRRTRRKLADVILRRGWILAGPETTLVRFPLNGIDIALRRHALDGDPGWVDWLGRAYRMLYRDLPLTGGGG